MNRPPVSVVMAVLNGMPHVESSVRSVLAQSLTGFEFVIGDDGSTDGTTELLQQLAREDGRIRLMRRERPSGLAASANWVVGEANAPLVAIMHADDLAHPDRLARLVTLLGEQPDAVLAACLADGIDDAGRPVRAPDYWRLTRQSAFAPFSHSSIVFRRGAFERVGGYRQDAEYWEDLDLYLRLAELGRMLVIPEALASVRFSSTSARLTNPARRVDEAIDFMYRSVRDYLRGGEYPRHFPGGPASTAQKLMPETFIGRGSVQLWSGRSPRLFARMVRRADLRADALSMQVFAWTLWSTLSPRTMRLALRMAMRLRSRTARASLAGRPFVEWNPRLARRSAARGDRSEVPESNIRTSAWPLRLR